MSFVTTDLAIVGGGPAALTAALYAVRAGLEVRLWVGEPKGGQLMMTESLENWPGAEEGLTGPALMERMEAQLQRLGVELRPHNIQNLTYLPEALEGKSLFHLHPEEEAGHAARAVIWATGARAKALGLPSEEAFRNRGVSSCATCDGFLYRGRRVAVVGGGNTALEEALLLSHLAKKVFLIHRRETFRAEHLLQRRLQAQVDVGAIRLLLGWEVQEVLGDAQGVQALQLRATGPQAAIRSLEVEALFVAIGHHPAVEGVAALAELTNEGVLRIGLGGFPTQTSCPGLFAAGDVADGLYRQAITAAAMGCQAALDAKRYLEGC